MIRALVFDAYGTLFDVHSLTTLAEQLYPGRGAELSQRWRTKQLEYTWLRSLMKRYVDFNIVTREALRYAARALKLNMSFEEENALMDAYRTLTPFAEVPAALSALSNTHMLAILSNGHSNMLNAVVQHNGFDIYFPKRVLSVDAVQVFKPDPRVYQLAVDALQLTPQEIGFVSSNGWDAAGAKSFGFTVFWINRSNAPVELLGVSPDHVVTSLADVSTLIA